jgi:hypothetical protein
MADVGDGAEDVVGAGAEDVVGAGAADEDGLLEPPPQAASPNDTRDIVAMVTPRVEIDRTVRFMHLLLM